MNFYMVEEPQMWCKVWCKLQKQTYLTLKHADVKERGQKWEEVKMDNVNGNERNENTG